jgi:hypothetical protein
VDLWELTKVSNIRSWVYGGVEEKDEGLESMEMGKGWYMRFEFYPSFSDEYIGSLRFESITRFEFSGYENLRLDDSIRSFFPLYSIRSLILSNLNLNNEGIN